MLRIRPPQELGTEPADLSYVYAGYAPLSVRVLHVMAHASATTREEVLKLLPGPSVEVGPRHTADGANQLREVVQQLSEACCMAHEHHALAGSLTARSPAAVQ